MPPRTNASSAQLLGDSNNQVDCPLRNQDGSICRKRCIGEKRYRSMQEHIRRAHPEHYIAKLPATEHSFNLMVTSAPSDQTQGPQQNTAAGSSQTSNPIATAGMEAPHAYQPDRHGFLHDDLSATGSPRMMMEDYPASSMLPAASAAAALAQLGAGIKTESGWENTGEVSVPDDGRAQRYAAALMPYEPDWHEEVEPRMDIDTVELPPIQVDPANDLYPNPTPSGRPRDLLPSILTHSPPGRSATLPPLQRPLGPIPPRKPSPSKHVPRKARAGTGGEWIQRFQNGDRLHGTRTAKAQSVEPQEVGRRWEDLIEAAASANEDAEEDEKVPVPRSPMSHHGASAPPLAAHHAQFGGGGYQASPLAQALTPPSFAQEAAEPFTSVESAESGENYHMGNHALPDPSPPYANQEIFIYCAACGNPALLKESYACTECICGLCRTCVNILVEEQGSQRKCPRCSTIGGRYKPFQLDIR